MSTFHIKYAHRCAVLIGFADNKAKKQAWARLAAKHIQLHLGGK
jgi:hypothetical protein